MSIFRRLFGRGTRSDECEIIDEAIRHLSEGRLAEAAQTLNRSAKPSVRAQAQSVVSQLKVLHHAERFPALGRLVGSPQQNLQQYLETEIPYLEALKQANQ